MKNVAKLYQIIIIISLMIVGLIVFGFGNPTSNQKNQIDLKTMYYGNISNENSLINFAGSIGNITLNAKIPESPSLVPIYSGYFRDGDKVNVMPESAKEGGNVTLEQEAPDVAKKILEQYGGLPPDAIFDGATTHYANLVSRSTGQVVRREAIDTSVSWSRLLEGKPIIGDNDGIQVILGDNGSPLRIYKKWRTYSITGNVSIIPVNKAIVKLENGDVIDPVLDNAEDVTIFSLTRGNYIKDRELPIVNTEPVWIFYGNTSSGSYLSFQIYARQFANFSATPTSGKVPLTVTFTDTSDASPVKWFWDFGDGTNSTEQNPAHTYATAGTYNVSLKAWNDLGSDTMEKTAYITVRNPAAPVANFTASPVSGNKPLMVTFSDTSSNMPTSWQWDFGDDTNATVQNPVHTYSASGNYTVSLNVTNDDGTNSVTKPDYIKVTSLPPTTFTTLPTTTTTVTTIVTTTTTKPTPTETHAPLSPVVAVIGIALTGVFSIVRPKKNQ